MATVVDSLIVTLGLDPSDFTKGQKKAAAELVKGQQTVRKSVKETDSAVSKGAANMGKAITSAARQFAIAFLGFSGAAGFAKFMGQLNSTTRGIGLFAKNINTSAADVRNWGDVFEVAGSSAEALQGFLGNIAKQQYDLRTTGMFDWVKELNSMNVSLTDSSGAMKPVLQTALELAEAFEGVSSQYGRQVANQRGLAMGIDPTVMNVLLQGPRKIREMLAREKGTFQLKDSTVAAADRVGRKWTETQQRFRDFGLQLLEKMQPMIERLLTRFEQWLGAIDMGKLAENLESLTETMITIAKALAALVEWLVPKVQAAVVGVAKFKDTILPDEDRKAQNQAVNREFQKNPALEMLNALGRMYGKDEFLGRNTGDSLAERAADGDVDAQSHMAELIYGATGKHLDAKLSREDYEKIREAVRLKALQNQKYYDAKPAATTGALLPGSTGAAASPSLAMAGPSSRSVSSTVQVDNINVYSSAGDGRGLAMDMRREMERKQLIAQADYGLA